MPGVRGIRGRLAVALVALVTVTAVVLGLAASIFVDVRLHAQALEDARSQAVFDLSVIVPERGLPADPTPDDITRSALAATFLQRGVQTIVELGPRGVFRSTSALSDLPGNLPDEVRERVGRGELAYAWMDLGGQPSLVVGGRSAGVGPAFYFVRSVEGIREAVDQLRTALAVGALLAAVVALVTAGAIARGVLAPVQEASLAAERIERGDLSARVPVVTRDEFGTWAERFNRMAASLSDTIRRLEAAQQQNRRFVADVAHELRTPLAALVAEASIVGVLAVRCRCREGRRGAGRSRQARPGGRCGEAPGGAVRTARVLGRRGHGSAAPGTHPGQLPRQRPRARGGVGRGDHPGGP